MGKLMKKFKKTWTDFKNSCNAEDDLKAALKNHDAYAAIKAISHTTPNQDLSEDKILRNIATYGQSSTCDHAVLNEAREAVYNHYDSKLRRRFDFFAVEKKNRPAAGYKNADYVYGMAAYMDDAKKLALLGRAGITPDEVSSEALPENIVMGTARRGSYEAMKEVIRQGASLDKVFGFDEFPPMHAFSKPLFHAFHPGVTKALIETGKSEILSAVLYVIGEEKLMQIEKSCHRGKVIHPPSSNYKSAP